VEADRRIHHLGDWMKKNKNKKKGNTERKNGKSGQLAYYYYSCFQAPSYLPISSVAFAGVALLSKKNGSQ
jgi:hypothetical protein